MLSPTSGHLYTIYFVKTGPSIKHVHELISQIGIDSDTVCRLFWTLQVSSSHFQSNIKDYSIPNASWSPVMVGLYNELMEKTVDGSWTRLPGCWRSLQLLKEADLARIAKAVPSKFKPLYQDCLTWAGGGSE